MEKTSAVVNPAPESNVGGTSGGASRSASRSGGGERLVSFDGNAMKGAFIPFAEAFEEVTKLHGYALTGSGQCFDEHRDETS